MSSGINNQTIGSVIEGFCWWAMLIAIAVVSLLVGRFDGLAWQTFSLGFFIYCALFSIAVCTGLIAVNDVALRAALPIIVLLWLVCAWLLLQLVLPAWQTHLFSWQQVLQQPSWFDVSRTWSLVPDKTRWLLIGSCFSVIFFIILLAQINSEKRVIELCGLLFLIACVHAGVGLWALKEGVFLMDKVALDGHFDAARGWFVNRNHYAALLVLCAPAGILLSSVYPAKTTSLRFFCWVLFGVLFCLVLLALIQSQSRAGILSPFVAAMLVLILFGLRGAYLRRLLSSLAAVAVVVLSLLLLFGQTSFERLSSLSIGERGTQWQITWKLIQDAPWFGYGGGSYGTVFQAFRDHAPMRQVVYNQSHNEYLHLWLEQGLVGLMMWLALLGFVIRAALYGWYSSSSRFVHLSLVCCLIPILAALLQAGVDFNLQAMNLRTMFFVLVAIILSLPSIQSNKKNAQGFS